MLRSAGLHCRSPSRSTSPHPFAGPKMVARGYGRIVNVSSGWGSFAEGMGGPGLYGVTKAALNALTIRLAKELPSSVKVNAMCPGWVRTRIWAEKMLHELLTRQPIQPSAGHATGRRSDRWLFPRPKANRLVSSRLTSAGPAPWKGIAVRIPTRSQASAQGARRDDSIMCSGIHCQIMGDLLRKRHERKW